MINNGNNYSFASAPYWELPATQTFHVIFCVRGVIEWIRHIKIRVHHQFT